MNDKDKENFKGKLKICLKETTIYIFTGSDVIIPLFKYYLSDDVFKLVEQKLPSVLTIYEQADVYSIIISKIAKFLNYHELRRKVQNSNDEVIVPIEKLAESFIKDKISDITNNIIKELEEPGRSYGLIQLPNVEINENIEINNDLILVGDLEGGDLGDDYFRTNNDKATDYNFRLDKEKTYLLIQQEGLNWYSLARGHTEPLVYKKMKQKFKIFLGLSLIREIFNITDIIETEKDRNRDLPIWIFQSVEWGEGCNIPSDYNQDSDLIPESHPDFNHIRSLYSSGNDLRWFCFQKRFFLEDKINLTQDQVFLLNSLNLNKRVTKPLINLKEGKIIYSKYFDAEKDKIPEKNLRKEFGIISTIINSDDQYAERIKAASLWYFEGYCADNDTFKFMNYTIALESLLGEKNKENVPLTEALSGKCGFWLGKSLKEKEEIKKYFKDTLYKTRSKIVHTGKTILNKEDNEILKKLEEMTKQLINEAIVTYNPDTHNTDTE